MRLFRFVKLQQSLLYLSGHLQPPATCYLPTTDPATSDGDSILTCPHSDLTVTSRIRPIYHLRIHHTETSEPVPGVPPPPLPSLSLCIQSPHGPIRSHLHPRKRNPAHLTPCASINMPLTSHSMKVTIPAGTAPPMHIRH
ncbi:unnamed protein product [Schistocephalus solidus]|uniref:Uncharacterized protein n=1 Tax=Schistocephalus solidus TaxID=70667 RepID=A0A183TLM7_SCHSO|nr:unnamed protein product [Schistocephalus solidus]